MLAAVIAIVAAIQALASVVATVWVVGSAARSQPVSPKEQERARMRSLSWPPISSGVPEQITVAAIVLSAPSADQKP